jgi:hypothetical protein
LIDLKEVARIRRRGREQIFFPEHPTIPHCGANRTEPVHGVDGSITAIRESPLSP